VLPRAQQEKDIAFAIDAEKRAASEVQVSQRAIVGAEASSKAFSAREGFFVAPYLSPNAVQQKDLADAIAAEARAAYIEQVSRYTIGQAQAAEQTARSHVGQQAAQWAALSAQQASLMAQQQAENARAASEA
jgi:hypothetical protein